MGRSDVRYATSADGIDVAYQVVGTGPVDLLFVSGFITHLDLAWDLPQFGWLEQLGGVARVITFDKRGTGLSDRTLGFGSLEERTGDVDAVLDAVGSDRVYLMGVSEGGPMSVLYAATNPRRVAGLVLYGTAPRFSRSDDYPSGVSAEFGEKFVAFVRDQWGSGEVFSRFLHNAPDPEAARSLIARFERNACTPRMAAEIMRRNLEIDVRPLLGSITAPTLVIHADGDPTVPVEGGRYLADHIPSARMLELRGDYHSSWDPVDIAMWREAVIDFIAGDLGAGAVTDRVLASVLFTDIVASTEVAARLGDTAWHSLLDVHDRAAASLVDRIGGRFVKGTGDGVLATFDGPSKAISCGQALMGELRAHGIEIRAGVHTGEIEIRGADIAGVGVVIASRICDRADGGEVLVSRTVKDLVAGSRLVLADRGSHELKGLDEPWHLYAVVAD